MTRSPGDRRQEAAGRVCRAGRSLLPAALPRPGSRVGTRRGKGFLGPRKVEGVRQCRPARGEMLRAGLQAENDEVTSAGEPGLRRQEWRTRLCLGSTVTLRAAPRGPDGSPAAVSWMLAMVTGPGVLCSFRSALEHAVPVIPGHSPSSSKARGTSYFQRKG